jgi:hypothetical protein
MHIERILMINSRSYAAQTKHAVPRNGVTRNVRIRAKSSDLDNLSSQNHDVHIARSKMVVIYYLPNHHHGGPVPRHAKVP